jgi:hypothetical protein
LIGLLSAFFKNLCQQACLMYPDSPRFDQKISDFFLDMFPITGLVEVRSLEPLQGIELDDASHLSYKCQERDGFVNAVFQAAELPLHRIRASSFYDPQALRQTLFGSGQGLPLAGRTEGTRPAEGNAR